MKLSFYQIFILFLHPGMYFCVAFVRQRDEIGHIKSFVPVLVNRYNVMDHIRRCYVSRLVESIGIHIHILGSNSITRHLPGSRTIEFCILFISSVPIIVLVAFLLLCLTVLYQARTGCPLQNSFVATRTSLVYWHCSLLFLTKEKTISMYTDMVLSSYTYFIQKEASILWKPQGTIYLARV